jgi:MFS family permease
MSGVAFPGGQRGASRDGDVGSRVPSGATAAAPTAAALDEGGEQAIVASESAGEARPALWSRSYVLVCVSNFLSYANQTMLTPVLPLFLVGLGYTPAVVGVAIAAFSVTSFVARPFIGVLVDRSSPRRTYAVGALVSGATTFVLVVPNLLALLATRAVGGVGWAAINTAGSAMAADLAPPSRRGEALGYFTMMISLAKVTMPAVGLWLAAQTGYWSAFVVGGLFGLGAVATSVAIHEPQPEPVPRQSHGRRGMMPDRGVIPPTVLVTILDATTPIATAFIVIYATAIGITDIWILFVANGLAAIGVRLLGRISDRTGRMPILSAGLLVAGVGLLLMLAVPTLAGLTAGSVMFAAGQGFVSPAALAMVVDVTPPGRRGVAMAFYTSSYPLGMAIGGLIWGIVIETAGYPAMFVGGGLLLAVTAVVVAAKIRVAGGSAARL